MRFSKDKRRALQQARNNANFSGQPRYVWLDEYGWWHVESGRISGADCIEVFPDAQTHESRPPRAAGPAIEKAENLESPA